MGSIFTRTLSDGTLRYRAVIRIQRKDYPAFRESKTFTTKRIAEKWVKKREVEIENNPDILNGNQHEKSIRLSDAIDLYLNETEGVYSKTKVNALKLIKKFPIAKKSIMKLNSMDLSDHVALRKTYCPKAGVGSIVTWISSLVCSFTSSKFNPQIEPAKEYLTSPSPQQVIVVNQNVSDRLMAYAITDGLGIGDTWNG